MGSCASAGVVRGAVSVPSRCLLMPSTPCRQSHDRSARWLAAYHETNTGRKFVLRGTTVTRST